MKLHKVSAFLSLFGSFSTLLCCGIPALLVLLGLGASFAGLITAVPQITILSEYKAVTFSLSGLLILLSWIARSMAPEPKSCEIAENGATACETTKGWSFWILLASTVLFLIAVCMAFILPIILE